MKKLCVLVLLAGFVLQSANAALDLKQSKFTQVVNSVEIISSNSRHTAEVNDVFNMPDVLRTGAASRAELVANDGTITRVGANTIFSFDPAERTIDLQQGSLLFHAPHGKGGGTIHTGSATASVLGTTIIVTATPNGGFKVLCLEGVAEVRFLNGLHESLQPGQMTFILPGGQSSPIIVFRLDVETEGSLLVNGFNNPLPSWPAIENQITQQLTLLLDGRVADTDLSVGDNATPQTVQVVMNIDDEQRPNSSIVASDPVSSLPVNYPALDPRFTKTAPFTPPANFSEGLDLIFNNPSYIPQSGFIGNDIDIDTGTGDGGTPIDLSAFSGDSDFDIMAANDMKIWRSVYFTGDLPPTVALFAGGTMAIASGSTLEADTTGIFGLVAGNFTTLDTDGGTLDPDNLLQDVNVINLDGSVDILSESDLAMEDGGTVEAGGGNLTIESDGSLTLGNDRTVSITDDGHQFIGLAEGTINLSAADDLTMNDAQVQAGEDVSITSGGTVGEIPYGGDININDSEIMAGSYYVPLGYESAGGSVDIDAIDGNVMLCDDSICAASGIDSGSGNVTITAGGGTADLGDTYINAEGNVSIEGVDSVDLGYYGSDEINAGGSISLLSDNGNVYVDYTLTANGDVDITSGNTSGTAGGDINIDYSDIGAGDEYDFESEYVSGYGGNVYIKAYDGNVMIDDSDIYAYEDSSAGAVNIYASGSICLNGDESGTIQGDTGVFIDTDNSDINATGYTLQGKWGDVQIEAGGNASLSDDYISAGAEDSSVGYEASIMADGDVSITDGTTVDASGNVEICAYGSLFATADGEDTSGSGAIDIEDSDIQAGFDGDEACSSVKITAEDGGINLYDDEIEAYNDGSSASMGSITIKAGDNIIINGGTDIYAEGNVNISTGGSVGDLADLSSDSEAAIDIDCAYIYAGSDDSSDISDSGGSISIKSEDGDIHLYGDNIEAYQGEGACGNIRIDANGDVYVVGNTELQADGNVNICANESEEELGLDSSSSGYGDVDIDNSDIYSGYDGNVNGSANICITAGGNVSIQDGSTLESYNDIDITAGEAFNEEEVSSEPGGNVNIQDSDIVAGAYDNVFGGDVNIYAYNGNVCLDDGTTISASSGDSYEGNINITADDDINAMDSTLTADGGVNLTANNDNVKICDTSLFAGSGDVDVDADNGCLKFSDSYVVANGSVNLSAGNNIKIDDTLISATAENDVLGYANSDDEVSISSGESLCITGTGSYTYDDIPYSYDIGADYKVCLTGADGVSLDDVQVQTLVADPSDEIKIGSEDGNISITDGSGIVSTGCVKIEAYNDGVCITDSGITAEDGNISVKADGGMLYIDADNDFEVDASDSVYLDGECVTVNDTAIEGGSMVCINGTDGNVNLEDVNLNAIDGDADVSADYGSLTLEYGSADYGVTITAGGSVSLSGDYGVNITGEDTSDLINITACDGDVDISSSDSSVDIEDADITASGDVSVSAGWSGEISDTSITAQGGSIYAMANDGNVCIDDADLQAAGDASICATDGGIYVKDGSSIVVNGSISLNADDNITVCDSYLSASQDNIIELGAPTSDSSVNISSDGELTVDGTDGTITASGYDIGADHEVSLYGYNGVTIDNAIIQTLNSSDSGELIDVTSDGSICVTASTLTGSDDSINVVAYDNNDIYIGDNSTLQATGGDVTIGSGCQTADVKLSEDSICAADDVSVDAYYNVNICDSTIKAYDGSVNIAADAMDDDSGGMLTINSGNSFDESTEISYGDITYDICASDDVNLSGDCVDVDQTAIKACDDVSVASNDGNIELSDVDIVTYSGNVTLSANDGNLVLESGDADYGVNICAGACVDACATGNICISDTGIRADMYGEGGSAKFAAGKNLSVYDAGIEGDNVKMTAYNGVTISEAGIMANYGNVTIASGYANDKPSENVPTTANQYSPNYVGFTPISISEATTESDLEGDSDSVTISSDSSPEPIIQDSPGTLTISGAQVISPNSYVQLTSDTGDVDVENGSTIQAQNGSVDLTATAGNVNVLDSDVEADSGDVDITAGEDASISDSTITASGGVCIMASSGDVDVEDGSTIQAEGDNLGLSSATGNVIVSDSDLESDGGNVDINAAEDASISDSIIAASGGVCIMSSSGDVDIEDGSTIQAQGDNLGLSSATGNVNVSDSDLESDNGNVDINAAGDASISDSIINASQDVSIDSSGGMVSIDEGRTSFSDDFSAGVDIYAQGVIQLSGDCVSVTDAALYAQNDYYDQDGISIESSSGNVDLNDVEMAAYNGNINIYATDGSLSLEEGSSSYGVNLQAYNSVVLGADDGVTIADATINAGDDIDICSGEDISLTDTYLDATENICIMADGDICVSGDDSGNQLYTGNGNIGIVSYDGNVYVDNSQIEANGDVTIGENNGESSGNVGIMDSDITADYGSVTLDANGCLKICDSDISGFDVSMDSAGALKISDDTIDAGETVSLTSDDENVGVYNSTITDDGNCVSISAENGDVNMMGDEISVGGGNSSSDTDISISDVSICASGAVCITANGGAVTIDGEDVSVCGTDFYFGGNVSISDNADISAQDGDVNITSGGTFSVDYDGTESFSGDYIYGGNIMICDSDITANYGNVNIQANFCGAEGLGITVDGGSINIGDSTITAYDEGTEGLGNINISTLGNVSISDYSDIEASEDISINAGGNICVTSSSISSGDDDSIVLNAGGYVNVDESDVPVDLTLSEWDITAGSDASIAADEDLTISDSTITANTGDIDITAGGDVSITYSTLSAADSTITVDAGGSVYVDDSLNSSDLMLSDWDITAGTDASINADQDLCISDSTILANGGDIDITAGDSLTISGGTITASDGNVNIDGSESEYVSGGATPPTYDLTIESDASIEGSESVNVFNYGGDIDINTGSTLTADTGDINILATGNLDIDSSTLSATGGGTDVTLNGTILNVISPITAIGGTISLSADNDLTLNNVTFNVGGDVVIENGADITASTGDLDITAEGALSTSAGGTIDISGIAVNGGNISITGSTVTSALNNVNLNAGESITIGSSTVSATQGGTDVDLPASETIAGDIDETATGGQINLTAGNNVVLSGAIFDTGGDINVAADSTIDSTGGNINLAANGELSIAAGGSVDINSCTVNGGSVNIDSGAIVEAAQNVSISGPNGVNVTGATIDANTTSGTVTLDAASTSPTAGVSVQNSTIQTAYLTVNSGDGILINGATLNASRMNLTTSLGTAADDVSGDHTVAINNTDLSGVVTTAVSAHTVNLTDDNFSSANSYTFTSYYGKYDINSGYTAGYVNFVSDTVDHSALTSANVEMGGTGTGIHVN